jgi:hypothetical protein
MPARVHLLKVRLRAVQVSLHLEEHRVELHLPLIPRVLPRWQQAWAGGARWQETEQPLEPLPSWKTFFRCDQKSRASPLRRVLPKEQTIRAQAGG